MPYDASIIDHWPGGLFVCRILRSMFVSRKPASLFKSAIFAVILLHEKFLQFDWLRAVVFQLNLKCLHLKITNLWWVRDIWHRPLVIFFKIVSNFTRLTACEITYNISWYLCQTSLYKSCYYLYKLFQLFMVCEVPS